MSTANAAPETMPAVPAALPPDPNAAPPPPPAAPPAKNAEALSSLRADLEAQDKLDGGTINAFSGAYAFETAQRMATLLSKSTLVPKEYQGNISNCLLAIEISSRMQASPIMVMQNLDIIHGRPGWRATFLIAMVNTSHSFTPLRFHFQGKEGSDDWGCRAVAKDRETGEECLGTLITIKMAKAEGWYDRGGSKWKTMPEQMLQYRSAAFWNRIYSPETGLGLRTADEIEDTGSDAGGGASAGGMQPIPGAGAANEGRRVSLRTGPVIDVEPEAPAAPSEPAKAAAPAGEQLPLGSAAPAAVTSGQEAAVVDAARTCGREPGDDSEDEETANRRAAEPTQAELDALNAEVEAARQAQRKKGK